MFDQILSCCLLNFCNGLNCAKGIGQSIFQTINDINIRLICHGASANNLCFLVAEEDANKVVEQLHNSLLINE